MLQKSEEISFCFSACKILFYLGSLSCAGNNTMYVWLSDISEITDGKVGDRQGGYMEEYGCVVYIPVMRMMVESGIYLSF